MLLSEGSIVYHGPREGVLPFFEELGLHLPPRKGACTTAADTLLLIRQRVRLPPSLTCIT